MLTKSKYHKEYTKHQIDYGYHYMLIELADANAPVWLCELFKLAWEDFESNKFSYDGATFVKERSEKTLFEVASFIHDWLNALGYVSYAVDDLFLEIMRILNYPKRKLIVRWWLTRLTFLNKLRHKYYLKDYKGNFPYKLLLNQT